MTIVEIGGNRAAIHNDVWSGEKELVARLAVFVLPRHDYAPNRDYATAARAIKAMGGKIVKTDFDPDDFDENAVY